MNMGQAISSGFKRYVDFEGRSARSEYWWWTLFVFLVNIFATIIDSLDQGLFSYPADTIVLPGHGNWTTIGAERPHLQEWVDRGW